MSDAKATKPPVWSFTQDGCRSEIRLGALLVLAAVFVWLMFPLVAGKLVAIGVPLILVGTLLQTRDAGRGRPGYPVRLAVILTIYGAFATIDLSYRESVGGPLQFQPTALLLLLAGLWLLAFWPIARKRLHTATTVEAAG